MDRGGGVLCRGKAMERPLSPLISAALALGAALAAAPQPAAGARVEAQATAVIRSGISVRSAGDPAAEATVRTAAASQPVARTVVRPCRPGEAASMENCRIVLLEMQ